MKWLNVESNCFTIANGTRHWSIFSPYLFSRYIRGLIRNIVNYKVGCNVGMIFYNVLVYEDDMVLLALSWHALQDLINALHDKSVLLDMKCNTAKTYCMVFSKRNKNVHNRLYLPCLKLINAQLNCHVLKHLGHIITNKLTDDDDIKREIQNLYVRCNVLFRKYQRCFFSVKVKLF